MSMDALETNTVLALPGQVTAVALEIPKSIDYETWAAIGSGLKNVEQSIMFWIGDWLTYGEGRFSDRWTQVLSESEYSLRTIQNAMWLSKRIPPERRRADVSYSHHLLVAALEPDEQEKWLRIAADEDLTREALRDRLRADKAEKTHVSAHDRSMPKDKAHRDQSLRDDAEHEDCIRCGAPNAVSAHYSGVGKHLLGGGMTLKTHDIATAHLCHKCHTEFDSYEATNSYERGWEFLVMILKTLVRRIEKGTVIVK